MRRPSFSLIVSGVFLSYICYSLYSISLLFIPPACGRGESCLGSYLNTKPELQLDFYSSVVSQPLQTEVSHVFSSSKFKYEESQDLYVFLITNFFC